MGGANRFIDTRKHLDGLRSTEWQQEGPKQKSVSLSFLFLFFFFTFRKLRSVRGSSTVMDQ